MSTVIFAGLLLGLTSNFHCVGMCGPIALAIPLDRSSNLRALGGALLYNFGRVFTYVLLGVLFGSIGLTVETMGVLQWLSIIVGILMIAYAWRKYFQSMLSGWIRFDWIDKQVSRGMGKMMKQKSPLRLFPMGMLNGILPCGMVFAGLFNAAIAGSITGGALSMLAFGVGTLPMMLTVTFLAGKINSNLRAKFNTAVPYLLTVVGLMIVLRGLNLGIPFISPRIKANQTEQMMNNSNEPQVEMSCCHSSSDSCEK